MKNNQTIYSNWVMDFRKILFCIVVLALGTIYNVNQPNALAIAIIVQGVSNIDGFWDYLSNKNICVLLKIMSALLILASLLASLFAVFVLGSSKGYFDTKANKFAWIYIALVLLAVVSPIIPLVTDMIMNLKKESKDGGDEDDEG